MRLCAEPDDDLLDFSVYVCHLLHLTTAFTDVLLVDTELVYP